MLHQNGCEEKWVKMAQMNAVQLGVMQSSCALKFLPAVCCPLVDLALANSLSRCRECRVPLNAEEKPSVTDVTQAKLFRFRRYLQTSALIRMLTLEGLAAQEGP